MENECASFATFLLLFAFALTSLTLPMNGDPASSVPKEHCAAGAIAGARRSPGWCGPIVGGVSKCCSFFSGNDSCGPGDDDGVVDGRSFNGDDDRVVVVVATAADVVEDADISSADIDEMATPHDVVGRVF